MQSGTFVKALAGGVVITGLAGAGVAVGLNAARDDRPAATTPVAQIVRSTPETEEVVTDGPPTFFRELAPTLSADQKQAIQKSITDQKLNPAGAIGVAIASDGWVSAFDPDKGPPARSDGKDPGEVNVFVFGNGLPPELK